MHITAIATLILKTYGHCLTSQGNVKKQYIYFILHIALMKQFYVHEVMLSNIIILCSRNNVVKYMYISEFLNGLCEQIILSAVDSIFRGVLRRDISLVEFGVMCNAFLFISH
jgi:hypothetical protein